MNFDLKKCATKEGVRYVTRNGRRIAVETMPDPPEVAAKIRKRAKRRQDKFVVMPFSWIEKLALSRSANTYRLAQYLLYEHLIKGRKPIKVSNIAALDGAFIGREAKRRGLLELEAYGLIHVDRRCGCSPTVTVIVE
jgi:hypothetical protein